MAATVHSSMFAPRTYLPGTILTVKSVGLFSPAIKPNEPQRYRALPVCKPNEGWIDFTQTLGEKSMYEEIVNTAYEVQIGNEFTNVTTTVCPKYLPSDPEMYKMRMDWVIYAIYNQYRMYFTFDGLPNIYPLITPYNQVLMWGNRYPVHEWPADAVAEFGDNYTAMFEYLPFDVINVADLQVGVPIGFEVTASDHLPMEEGFYMYQHYNIHVYGEHSVYIANTQDVFWLDLSDEQRLSGVTTIIKIHRFAMYPDRMSAVRIGTRNATAFVNHPTVLNHTYSYSFYEESAPWITRWTTLFYSSPKERNRMFLWTVSTSAAMFVVALFCTYLFYWYSKKGITVNMNIETDRDKPGPIQYDHTKWRNSFIDFFRPPRFHGLMNIFISCACQIVFMCIIIGVAVLTHAVTNNLRGSLDWLLIAGFIVSNSVHGVIYSLMRNRWLREDGTVGPRALIVYTIAFLFFPCTLLAYNVVVGIIEYVHIHRTAFDFSEWLAIGLGTMCMYITATIGFMLVSSMHRWPSLSPKSVLEHVKWLLRKNHSQIDPSNVVIAEATPPDPQPPPVEKNEYEKAMDAFTALESGVQTDLEVAQCARSVDQVKQSFDYRNRRDEVEYMWRTRAARAMLSQRSVEYWNICRFILPAIYGVMSFGIIAVPFHFMLNSMWGGGVDTMYSITFMSGVSWMLFNWVFACMFVLVMLNHQDPCWHWPCFHFAASGAYYMFVYCIIYWMFVSSMHGISPFLYYMCFCSLICLMAWITVGGSSVFVVYIIFGAIYKKIAAKRD